MYPVAAAVEFVDWEDRIPTAETVRILREAPAPYEPGASYKREIPFLRSVLLEPNVYERFTAVVVDGYVWLGESRPGLGAHLYSLMSESVPVIGVGKTRFRGAPALEVQRGCSSRPLYVTAAGVKPEFAAECIRKMDGAGRIPSLLKRVDRLARNWHEAAPITSTGSP